jgi:hypothetical protein
VGKRTGHRLPSMKWLCRRLKEYGYGDMVHGFSAVANFEYVPPEQMDEAVKLVYREGKKRINPK